MKKFVRSLPDELISELGSLATRKDSNWWRDILSYEAGELHFAIRERSLNVYAKGQSVFKVELGKNKRPLMTTHYKYLLRPKMPPGKEYATFDGEEFRMGGQPVDAVNLIQSSYDSKTTIRDIVQAAITYSDAEKSGVHTIANANPSVIDMEIAFTEESQLEDPANFGASESTTSAQAQRKARRIDLAALQPKGNDRARVVFYEVKRFNDARLWGSKPEVITQLDRYNKFIKDNEPDIKDAYENVCELLVQLRKAGSSKSVSSLISEVAGGQRTLEIDKNCRLVVFGFDKDQKDSRLEKLKQIPALKDRLIAVGNPKALKLK